MTDDDVCNICEVCRHGELLGDYDDDVLWCARTCTVVHWDDTCEGFARPTEDEHDVEVG